MRKKVMEILFNLLVICGCCVSVINFMILIYIVIFLVNLRKSLIGTFEILMEAITGEPRHVQEKSWDEKHMEELSVLEKYRRDHSGLQDLAEPTTNYGAPPVKNINAEKGLTWRNM